MVAPRKTEFLGNIRLLLPKEAVGRRIYKLRYRMYKFVNNKWVD